MEIAKSEGCPDAEVKQRKWWRRVLGWQYLGLCLLVIATLAIHFSTIMEPAELVFDEHYYIPDARSIINGEGTLRPEHPPLGKLFIAAGMLIFGDNPLGWRFFPVIFGTIIIVLFYFICRKLAMSQRASLLATFLLALDDMSFIQASMSLLDVYVVAFMMAGFLLYLHKGYLLSGMSIALSALAKLTGALAFIGIVLHWCFASRERPKWFIGSIIVTLLSFLVFMMPLDYFAFGGQFLNPLERTWNIVNMSGSITFDYAKHPYMSRPWEWILLPKIMPYWWDPQYITFISFTIWVLIIPAIIYMFYKARKGNDAARFGLAWFAGTYLTWIPLSLATDRVSFLYYFYPTVGAICIGIGLGLSELIDVFKTKTAKHRKAMTGAIVTYLLLHLAIFVIFNPAVPVLIPMWKPPFA